MDLASVRALKAELNDTLIKPMLVDAPVLHSFGIRAVRNSRVTGVTAGVALGVAKGRGKDFKLAVRLQRRALERDAAFVDEITKRANREIDVRYVGRLYPHDESPWYQQRQRPLLIGASVAHVNVTAGTIGCFPLHSKSQKRVILSNNHVLADERRGKVGDLILQPGPFDGGGRKKDRVGLLLDFVPLKNSANVVDAAIASIESDILFDERARKDLETLNGVRPDSLIPGDKVSKIGRTTGETRGVVTAIEVDDLVIDYERGALSFDRQVEIEGAGNDAFSAGGDSGSLIVDEQGMACALLFAGGDVGGTNNKGLTYANPIGDVLQSLGLVIEFPAP